MEDTQTTAEPETTPEPLTLPTPLKDRRFPATPANIIACIAEAFRMEIKQRGGVERTPRRGSMEIRRISECLQNTGMSALDVEKALDQFRRLYPVFDFETRADLYQIRPARGWEFCGQNGFRPERPENYQVLRLKQLRQERAAKK